MSLHTTPVAKNRQTSSTESPSDDARHSEETIVPTYHNILLDEVVENLRNYKALPRDDNGSPVLASPFTQEQLEGLVDQLKMSDRPLPKMFVEDGKLLLDEDLGTVHESVSRSIVGAIVAYNTSLSGRPNRPLFAVGAGAHRLNRGKVQPDEQFEVHTVPRRGCPNFVVEVAHEQGLRAAVHRAERYFRESDNILICLVVKIYSRRVDGSCAMLALLYYREPNPAHMVPQAVISFGTAPISRQHADRIVGLTQAASVSGFVEDAVPLVPCDRLGIPMYQLAIDHLRLLATNPHGDGEVAANHVDVPDFVMDLFNVQEDAIHTME
eukprot:gene15978-18013_t